MSGHTNWSLIKRSNAARSEEEPSKEEKEKAVEPETNATFTKLTPDSGASPADSVAQPAPNPGELWTGNNE